MALHQHLFFVVRYSVLVNEPSWNLAKDPTSEYRQRLFDPERLSARLSLF